MTAIPSQARLKVLNKVLISLNQILIMNQEQLHELKVIRIKNKTKCLVFGFLAEGFKCASRPEPH